MTGLRTRLARLERAAAHRHPQPVDVPITEGDLRRAIAISHRRLAALNARTRRNAHAGFPRLYRDRDRGRRDQLL